MVCPALLLGQVSYIREDRFTPSVNSTLGPAHAVYFATYEGVKQLMGGNQAGVHHPLAAGKYSRRILPLIW